MLKLGTILLLLVVCVVPRIWFITSSEPKVEIPPDNDVSISAIETQPGNEHSPSDNEKDNDKVHEVSQPNNEEPDNDVEIERPVDLDNPQPKNKRYDKKDFVARK